MVRASPRILPLMLAALALAVTAAPCAARGTGGFLRAWTVCGPLPGTRLDVPDLPADFTAYPGLMAAGGVWLPIEAETRGRVNLKGAFPQADSGTALLHTFFQAPEDGTYRLRIGSDDGVRVDLNGRQIHLCDVRRSWRADQDTVAVRLTAGWHRLLVRVVDHGGEWAVSVRLANEADRPIDVPHQAECPEPFVETCRLQAEATVGERAEAARYLAVEAARLQADLRAAVPPLAETPEGYVAFAEYQSARDLGRRFFEALATLWQEGTSDTPNAEIIRAEQHRAEEAARGLSEVLARETDQLTGDLATRHGLWRRLGTAALARRDLAECTLQIAQLMARTRSLAERIESERLLAARFENDIRNFRQRDLVVRVRDADGRPVPGAVVEIVQQQHDFPFGCNLFAFGRWGEKKNGVYEQRFLRLFNLAVVPVYWSVLEREQGQPAYGRVDAAIRWCRSNGISVRAHPLVWPAAVPRWADRLGPEEAREALRTHLDRTVRRYRAGVAWWDVLYGPAEAVAVGEGRVSPAEVLAWSAGASPTGGLLMVADDAEALVAAVRQVRDDGPAVAGVGLTAHQHEGVWSVEELRKRISRAAAAGRPVHIAAVTILGDPETEAEQAEAVRHFYTAAFAHPKVASITWWDLSDRFAWRNAPAGLLRADLSPKPAYRVLDDLLNLRWRTNAAGRTDADGAARARVFFGAYQVAARADGRQATLQVHLGKGGPGTVEVTLPPGK